MAHRLRILVVDDHRTLSGALTAFLGREEDLEVVGTVPSATAARAAVAALEPDVALIDVDLGEEDDDGIDLVAELAGTGPELVVMTCHSDVGTAVAAVRAGAAAFVPKDSAPNDLLRAVRGAARGEGWLPAHLLRPVLDVLRRGEERTPEQQRLDVLSPREREVLRHMMGGADRSEIADALYLSANTVRTHARNILAKLDVHSTLEAVSLAYRAGLRPPEQTGNAVSPGG